MGIISEKANSEEYWVRYVKNRIKKKKNFLMCMTGPTGSGKSWSALSICYKLDKGFTPKRIVFDVEELMELINNGNLKTGSAILWDEAGVGLSNKNWQSMINKTINYLLQTFRHKRLILIMTVPYLDFIDSSTRKLFHSEFLTRHIKHQQKKCIVKPQLIQYNPRNKKFYYKYLRVNTKRGVAPVVSWGISSPPKWLIDSYEDLKIKFTSKLNLDIQRQIKGQRIKESNPLTEKQEEVFNLVKEHGDPKVASEKSGIPVRTIYFHLQHAKKKGYEVEKT